MNTLKKSALKSQFIDVRKSEIEIILKMYQLKIKEICLVSKIDSHLFGFLIRNFFTSAIEWFQIIPSSH